MDKENLHIYKIKYAKLVFILNIIVALVAAAFIVLVKIASPYGMVLSAILFVSAAVLLWNFRQRYYETKTWLIEHTGG